MASRGARYEWPALDEARRQAAERGATSIGTQHVLFALLAGPDEDARAALAAGGVDPRGASAALEAIAGIGSRQEPVDVESVPVSDRVERLLEQAAAHDDPAHGGRVHDRDVLRALLLSDDPAVGHLMVTIMSEPERIVAALDEIAARQADEVSPRATR